MTKCELIVCFLFSQRLKILHVKIQEKVLTSCLFLCIFFRVPCEIDKLITTNNSKMCSFFIKPFSAPKYCQIFGDPHYNTYDNVMYRFAGECSYKLTETCGRIRGVPTFRVVGTNEKTLDGYESTNLKSIQLSVKGKTYVLDSSGQATVQGSYVDSYPYVDEDSGIVITLSYPSLVSILLMNIYSYSCKYLI